MQKVSLLCRYVDICSQYCPAGLLTTPATPALSGLKQQKLHDHVPGCSSLHTTGRIAGLWKHCSTGASWLAVHSGLARGPADVLQLPSLLPGIIIFIAIILCPTRIQSSPSLLCAQRLSVSRVPPTPHPQTLCMRLAKFFPCALPLHALLHALRLRFTRAGGAVDNLQTSALHGLLILWPIL